MIDFVLINILLMLCTAELIILFARVFDKQEVFEWDDADFLIFITLVIFYPIGLFMLLMFVLLEIGFFDVIANLKYHLTRKL